MISNISFSGTQHIEIINTSQEHRCPGLFWAFQVLAGGHSKLHSERTKQCYRGGLHSCDFTSRVHKSPFCVNGRLELRGENIGKRYNPLPKTHGNVPVNSVSQPKAARSNPDPQDEMRASGEDGGRAWPRYQHPTGTAHTVTALS